MIQQAHFWVFFFFFFFSLLGFNPKKLKLDSPRDIFIPVFVAALFTITNTGKQPKCPLMYQWIDI